MSPLNEQQLEQIRNERIEQIKKAAIKVFAQHGIEGTKMSMIAEAAGISQGLSYRYFKSKDELFTTLVKELMEEADQELKFISDLPGTPSEQIRTLTQQMLDGNNKHSFMFIQQARAAQKVPYEVKQILEQYSPKILIDRLIPVFIKGQQVGEFCEGDPRKLLSWYFFIVNCITMQKQGDEEYGLPEVDIIMRILTQGTIPSKPFSS